MIQYAWGLMYPHAEPLSEVTWFATFEAPLLPAGA